MAFIHEPWPIQKSCEASLASPAAPAGNRGSGPQKQAESNQAAQDVIWVDVQQPIERHVYQPEERQNNRYTEKRAAFGASDQSALCAPTRCAAVSENSVAGKQHSECTCCDVTGRKKTKAEHVHEKDCRAPKEGEATISLCGRTLMVKLNL